MKIPAWSILLVLLLAILGWVLNVVAVVGLAVADAPITAMFILRIVGVFLAPLGAILGFVCG